MTNSYIVRKYHCRIFAAFWWENLFDPLRISQWLTIKLGGLDLSRRGLDRDSRSRRQKSISLDVMDNLDVFQKLVSTIKKSRSRSRFLDLVWTSMSRPKSLDRDREIRWHLKILAFLNSLSRSRSRSAWIFVFSRQDFLTNLDSISTNLDKSQQISTNLDNLDKSRQSRCVSTISTKILTRQSLNWKVSILKISTENKKRLISTWWIILTVFKSSSRRDGCSRSRSQLVSNVETPKLTHNLKILNFSDNVSKFAIISQLSSQNDCRKMLEHS